MPSVEVVLACKHARWWSSYAQAPKHGDRIYCHACSDMRDVIGHVGQYRAKCRNCRWARTYAKDSALAKAVRVHLRMHLSHVMKVTRIGEEHNAVDVRWTEPVTSMDQQESLL